MTHTPSYTELVARLTQLEARVEQMVEKTALAAQFTQLETQVGRLVACVSDTVDIVARRVDLLDQSETRAFERIIALELTVFPHLQADMQQLHAILGPCCDKADQPLDRRFPKTP